MKLRFLLAGLSAGSLLVVATAAQAAPAPVCVPATITPHGSAIPASFPGFAYTALSATAKDVHLFASDTSVELPLIVGPVADGLLKVAPSSPLVAGKSYRLEFSPFCSYGPTPPQGPITFTATAGVPLPTKIGSALTTPTVTLRDFGTTAFSIATSSTLDAEIGPWLTSYQLVLLLDGKPVATTSTFDKSNSVQLVGEGWCDTALSSTDQHTVQLRARLPFAPTVDTESSPITFHCPAPAIGTPPNNPATPPPPGAVNPTSSGSSGEGSKASISGCSVSLRSSQGPVSSLPLLGLALGMVAVVRRRLSAAKAATRRT